jgi:hypothetical protein
MWTCRSMAWDPGGPQHRHRTWRRPSHHAGQHNRSTPAEWLERCGPASPAFGRSVLNARAAAAAGATPVRPPVRPGGACLGSTLSGAAWNGNGGGSVPHLRRCLPQGEEHRLAKREPKGEPTPRPAVAAGLLAAGHPTDLFRHPRRSAPGPNIRHFPCFLAGAHTSSISSNTSAWVSASRGWTQE